MTSTIEKYKTPGEIIAELKTLLDDLDKGKISVQDFIARMRGPYPDTGILTDLNLHAHQAEGYNREIQLWDEVEGLFSVFHLVACAVDVARQADTLEEIDNLIIHPLATDTTGKGKDILLGYASEALTWVLNHLMEKGILFKPLGAKVEKEEEEGGEGED